MELMRRYHRFVRAVLFVVILVGVVAFWQAEINTRLLDLATFDQFISMFVLIGVAGAVTHFLGRRLAPVENGQLEEDSGDNVTGPDVHDV